MNDLYIIFLLFWAVCAFAIGVLLWLAVRWHGARVWKTFVRFASTNPYEPRATLLQSSDGSITMARLKCGKIVSLRRKPRGKALRKQWRRMKRRLAGISAPMAQATQNSTQ